jgi:hypothetical protein
VIEMSEQTMVNDVASRLAQQFPAVPAATIATIVNDTHARFDGRPLREFVPLLVERDARASLAKLGS